MFVQYMAKTEMTHFWQFMFDLCNEEYSCVLGWGLGGVVAILGVVLGFGFLITRANKRREYKKLQSADNLIRTLSNFPPT